MITPADPPIVIYLFFYYIPGKIDKEIKNPPINPPIWPILSTFGPKENNSEKNSINPIIQQSCDLIGPSFPKALQLISI